MTNLYLIAHKVRGEPAFDVAIKLRCPECEAAMQGLDYGTASWGCNECDQEGWWWIIPTSGHRAYSYWDCALEGLFEDANVADGVVMSSMPPSLPDHYPSRSAPTISLAEALGLNKPKPQAPIVRRL